MKKQGNYKLQGKQKGLLHEWKNYYSTLYGSTGTSNYTVLIMQIMHTDQTKIQYNCIEKVGRVLMYGGGRGVK